jgi:hypothetical protein
MKNSDDDKVPVNFGAAREAHPGHGDEPKGGGKGDLDGNGMNAGLGLARALIRCGIGNVLQIFGARDIAGHLPVLNAV